MNILKQLDEILFGKYKHQYGKELVKHSRNINSLLDLGCGSNSPVKFIKDIVPIRVGVDLFNPSVEKSLRDGIHTDYKIYNVLEVDTLFPPKSFDLTVASDLIEHLEKEQGYKLLEVMESLALKKVIILTPNGFLKQGVYDGNEYQVHKSGWSVQDFRQRGYKVYGIMGLKSLRGEYSYPTIKPNFIGNRVSFLTQNFVYDKPEKAFSLMAIKDFS